MPSARSNLLDVVTTEPIQPRMGYSSMIFHLLLKEPDHTFTECWTVFCNLIQWAKVQAYTSQSELCTGIHSMPAIKWTIGINHYRSQYHYYCQSLNFPSHRRWCSLWYNATRPACSDQVPTNHPRIHHQVQSAPHHVQFSSQTRLKNIWQVIRGLSKDVCGSECAWQWRQLTPWEGAPLTWFQTSKQYFLMPHFCVVFHGAHNTLEVASSP